MKTLYYNGNIITMDKNHPKVEAVLTENKKIVGIGTYNGLLSRVDKLTKKVDLRGLTLLPGFVDTHSHASLVAKSLENVDLVPPPLGNKENLNDIKEALKKELKNNPKKYHDKNWLIGDKYDNKDFPNDEKLTKFELDEVSLDIPIFIVHFSYHSGVANSKLLELLNINENTIDENDDSYERVPGTKEPNGVLKEQALEKYPEIWNMITIFQDKKVWSKVWKPVIQYYGSQGYTTVQEGKLSKEGLEYLEYLDQREELVLDVISHIDAIDDDVYELMKKKWQLPNYSKNLKVKGAKLFFDGTLELWTAWLSKPYHTQINDNPPDYCGKPTIDLDIAYERILWCLNNKKQIIVHCIGDQASEAFIDLYEKALKETTAKEFLRPIMIHGVTVRYDQLKRMKKINMMPAYFAEDIYYFAEFLSNIVLGKERTQNIYPTGWTKELNVKFSFNHDCPVYPPNSMLTLHTIVNRLTQNQEVLGKEHRVSVYEALEALTINAAYQYHEENNRGSITVNKVADFVIVDKSPLEIDTKNIKDIKIIKTIKNDKVIYSA